MNRPLPLTLLAGLLIATTITPDQQESTLAHVANSYLNAMFGEKVHEVYKEEQKTSPFQLPDTKKIELNEREIQEIAFNLALSQNTPSDSMIDKTFIDKMELIAGGQNSNQHLFGHVFDGHISTALGKAHGAYSLCSPLTNTNVVRHRQEVIKTLLENEQLLNQIDAILKRIKSAEKTLLMFWHEKPPVNPALLKFLYFGSWFKPLNTNTLVMETTNKLGKVFQITFGLFGMPGAIIWSIANADNCSLWQSSKLCAKACQQVFTTSQFNWTTKASFIALPAYQGLIAYILSMDLKNKIEICNHLQDILIGTASYVSSLKQLGHILNNNKDLLESIPTFAHLTHLTNKTNHSKDFLKALNMLDTNTFTGEPSFFSNTGRVLATFARMKEVKDELIPALQAAGELDTYVALAKQYKAHTNMQAGYSFVEFTQSDHPVIEAIEFWNPFINADQVITNNVTLGTTNPNVILTGPNTGGKSTVIKGLVILLLLAQTYGIVPAEKLVITPFTKINSYLNITDNIAAGVSLFRAEALRAKELIATISSLPQNQFIFTAIDEIFSGTSPQEGETAACMFAKKLSNFNNSISIIATHYPKMIGLENDTQGAYKNYQVEIIREDDGTLNRTFKLLPGPSTINVAIDILKEEGIL